MRRSLLPFALALASTAATADPGYYVVTPYDRDGLTTVDVRYWTFKPANRTEVLWPEIGIGYGVNTRWSTLLLVSWEGTAHEAVRVPYRQLPPEKRVHEAVDGGVGADPQSERQDRDYRKARLRH